MPHELDPRQAMAERRSDLKMNGDQKEKPE
jgi:hypothetical protein